MTYKRFFWRVGRTVLLYGWFIGLSVLMAALLERGLLPQRDACAGQQLYRLGGDGGRGGEAGGFDAA